MTELMKAVQFHAFGGPEVLKYEDAPKPVPESGEVLVKVRAVGINPPDMYLRDGYRSLPPEWQPKGDFPIIPGTDISGVVEAVSDNVTTFKPGDEVYSMVRFPEGVFGASKAYAQYVTVPAVQLGHKPEGVDHEHAAAAPMSLLTAWQFLVSLGHDETNPVMPEQHVPVPLAGRTVMVNGAAGGVGHFVVQIAKWKDARVIAVASSGHERMLRDLGVDEFIDYTVTKPEEHVRDVDLVVDCVGGPNTVRFVRSIKKGGALFPIFPLGYEENDEVRERGVRVSATQVRSNGAQLDELAPLLSNGTIRPVIDSTYSLAEAWKAHERAARGNLQGKLVLAVN